MPTARDVMTTELVVLSPEMSVHEAMKLFLANRISGAPVVGPHGALVGILTERDCLQVIYRASYFKDPGGTVADHMVRDVVTVDADETVMGVIERFLASPYRRFPVVDGNRLVGLVSRREILRSVIDLW